MLFCFSCNLLWCLFPMSCGVTGDMNHTDVFIGLFLLGIVVVVIVVL